MRSFAHAFRGLATLLWTQRNARIHLLMAWSVAVAGLGFRVSALEWCALLRAMGFVVAAEALNTGIEFASNALQPGHRPLIGHAQDVAAGGVLVAAISGASVGAIGFVAKLPLRWSPSIRV